MRKSEKELEPKQLTMVIEAEKVRLVSDKPLPDGFSLRGYKHGDENSWISLLNCGDFDSQWDSERFQEYMTQDERLEGSSVILKDEIIVAATFASVQDSSKQVGRVDFVVSHPDFRGLGLGKVVLIEVLRFLQKKNYKTIMLYTDDWRIPALGMYLSLGFEPEITRHDMPDRWDKIKNTLHSKSKK